MSLIRRVPLDDEADELIDAARGTNEAFEVLTAVDDEIPIEEALETLRRVVARLPYADDVVL